MKKANQNITSAIDSISIYRGIESSRYFYHGDHLGSSSWITDKDGNALQYISYLPYGQLFMDLKTTSYDASYKFIGKERDSETGFDYFGARYYSSELGVWLSVDPLADERAWSSPYSYCQNNPIGRVDVSGALDDGYTVDKKGYFKPVNNEGGNNYDVIYKKGTYSESNRKNYDDSGTKNGLKITKGIIQSDNPKSIKNGTKTVGINNRYEIKSSKESAKIFDFMDKNTSVEWNNTQMRKSNGEELNFLMTSHNEDRIVGGYYRLSYLMRSLDAIIIRDDHNHPNGDPTPSGWQGDWGNGSCLQQLQPNNTIEFRILSNGKYHGYKIPPKR